MKIEGSGFASGSISQRHGSAAPDPDPRQNVIDPQHCAGSTLFSEYLFLGLYSKILQRVVFSNFNI
jgi:hypothetical protein